MTLATSWTTGSKIGTVIKMHNIYCDDDDVDITVGIYTTEL
jgi:hypothetical protein